MTVRGIRGATTVERDEEQLILQAAAELLQEIAARNDVLPEEIASVWVTSTHDLTATFPAKAIRQLPGWELVPVMCSLEIPVEPSLPKCIRVMAHVNTAKGQRDIHHVYLNNAKSLRPDIAGAPAK